MYFSIANWPVFMVVHQGQNAVITFAQCCHAAAHKIGVFKVIVNSAPKVSY